jgi:hypothetical protein
MLLPVMPTFVQDDGRLRFSAELFIVFHFAPRGERHLNAANCSLEKRGEQEMSSTRV